MAEQFVYIDKNPEYYVGDFPCVTLHVRGSSEGYERLIAKLDELMREYWDGITFPVEQHRKSLREVIEEKIQETANDAT